VVQKLRQGLLVALVVAGVAVAPAPGWAQNGATLTPDRLSYLVSKEVGGARWTISLNVAPDDESTIVNMTGNILVNTGEVIFVHCLPRAGSTRFLREAGQLLTFDCMRMGACDSSAVDCSRFEWSVLTGPGGFAPCESFFLPGTTGACPGVASTSASQSSPPLVLRAASDINAGVANDAAEQLMAAAASAPAERLGPVETVAADNGTARTLTADGYNYLLTFEFFGARWSVGLNYFPIVARSGAFEKLLGGMTGNLFFPDGREPVFVHCNVRPDSTGRLDDPRSIFRFDCDTAAPCGSTNAVECAQRDWSVLSTNFQFSADNFLPPDGLGAPLGSDPGLIVLPPAGSPGSPGGIAAPANAANSSSVRSLAGTASAGGCPVGASCGMRIGGCGSVGGIVEQLPQCSCSVREIPNNCIECGRGATGRLGDDCSFPVTGSFTARGVCLPVSYLGNFTTCFPIEFQGESTIPQCGGPIGVECPSRTCCADDPRDGCVPSATNQSCNGICVDAQDCDPSQRECGICSPFLSGNGANGATAASAASAESVAYAVPIADASICGDGVRGELEACDGPDLSGATCHSLGYGHGSLACASDCRSFDTSRCTGL
jgi:hypothetical protein